MKLRAILTGLLALVLLAAVSIDAASLRIPQFGLYIPSTGGLLQIPIYVDSFPDQFGGFRLCLDERGYDFTVLTVEPGEMMTTCGWEYLNWRRVPDPLGPFPWPFSPGELPPTSLIEITGYAAVTAGYQASCFDLGSRMELVRLHVAMAAPSWPGNVNTECSFRPISFFWRDCFDNVLFSRNNDTIFSASRLYSPLWGYSPSDSLNIPFPGFGIPDQTCTSLTPSFDALNGAYDIICTDSTNPWLGDLNCDGYAYTMADVVAYFRYFRLGIGIFMCNQAQVISGSDINQDGITLTVADLVLLIKIASGDGLTYDQVGILWRNPQKPGTMEHTAEIAIHPLESGSRCSIAAETDIAACYLRLVSTDDHPLDISSIRELAPEATIGNIGDTLTLFWINLTGEPVFGSGSHALFASNDPHFRIVHSEIVDMDARPMSVTVSQSLPAKFYLEQNIPNPFNPTTAIGYTLTSAAQVTLDVYNVNGQRIIRLVDAYQTAGVHFAIWNAVDQSGNAVASGLYFYRLEAGGNVATRKMLLLK